MIQERPSSSKPTEFKPNSKTPKRRKQINVPSSSKNFYPLPYRGNYASKEADISLIQRIKPRNVLIERERLFEEVLSLKLKNNSL